MASPISKIPAVSFWQFLKHSFEIVKNPLPFHQNNFAKKGDTFSLHLGFGKRIIFSRDAHFLKYTLQTGQKNFTKSTVQTKDLAKYLGKGLLTAQGEHWKRQRKLIQPTFHKKYLQQLLEIMQEAIETEIAKIPKSQEVNIAPYFGNLAFQVVAKSLFSGDVSFNVITRLQQILAQAQQMLDRVYCTRL